MYSVRLASMILLVVLLSDGDASTQKVFKRTKRNNLSCRVKSLVRYRLTVNTLWSKETFPKMFPLYRPHPQWSSLVGHTHGSEHQLWQEGAYSTRGVKLFAEQGDISQLNIESFQGYDDILDSFVAPPVNTSVGQTSAVIILDGHHSKLSFMMKIIPSPDWFVGVSSLDLCAHGHWKKNVHVDLRPFDAGTDQGLTFTAPNWPNSPAMPISAITSSFPDHPASSFLYPNYEELPRIAFLDLDIVSEFRHRETFMNIPQHYTTSTDENDEADDDRKTKDDDLSTTTVDVENKLAKSPSIFSKQHGGSPTRETNDDPFVNKDISANVRGNGLSKTRWGNTKGHVAGASGRIFKVKDVKEDELRIQGKHRTTPKPIKHNEKQKDGLAVNAQSQTSKKDRNDQYLTKVQDDDSLDHSTKTKKHFTGNTGTNVSDSMLPSKETSTDEDNVKTTRTKHVFSISGLFRGTDVAHLKLNRKMSTPQTQSISSVDEDESLFHETSTQNMYESAYVDCEVGEWLEWSQCSHTCGFGQRERFRNVITYPQNGGVTCPRLKQTNLCGSMSTCERNHFAFLDPKLREGPTRHRSLHEKKIAEGLH